MRTPHSVLLLGAALLWAASHAAHAATFDADGADRAEPAKDACVSAATQQVSQQQRDLP